MRRLLFGIVCAMCLLCLSCGSDDGASVGPDPTLGEIDPRLYGTWDLLDGIGNVMIPGFFGASESDITYGGASISSAELVCGASGGQIWQANVALTAILYYLFDYSIAAGADTLLYLLEEVTPNATNPGPSTTNVRTCRKR